MEKFVTDGEEPISVGTVYVPNYKEIRVGELMPIIKRSRIPREKFE